MAQDRKERLQEFVAWAAALISGDEKGERVPPVASTGVAQQQEAAATLYLVTRPSARQVLSNCLVRLRRPG